MYRKFNCSYSQMQQIGKLQVYDYILVWLLDDITHLCVESLKINLVLNLFSD
jgi:hypothetical protein